jgi:hypothetical protein
MTLAEVATLLKSAPKSWNDLTAQEKQDVGAALRPVLGFDGQQRAWFGDWWFTCTQANVDAMNAALPAGTRVGAVSYLGTLYLGMDLATDCMQAGDTYAAVRPVLRTLVCTNIPNLPSLLPKPAAP